MNRWNPRAYTIAGAVGVVLAAVLVVVGHVDPSPGLDLWALTISEVAVSDRGGAIDVAMVTLALASLALLRGALGAGLPARGWPAALVGVWSAGLVVAAIVPTDPPGVALGPGGQVHRWASLVAFVCLPLAGFLLARRARDRRVALLSAASVGCLLSMLASATLAHRQFIGLAERLLIAVEVALLVVAVATRGRAPAAAGPAASPR